MKRIIVTLILTFLLLSACMPNDSKEKEVEITISAAASMTDAMEEIIEEFERENTSINVLLNVGSSGSLQQQIRKGAPVDLFISAAQDKFDVVLEEGLIDTNNYRTLLRNSLVLIKPINSKIPLSNFDSLLDKEMERVAIGTPETVPAGKYAVETLKSLELYDQLEEKLIQAKDVRQVLHYVETENVQAGIVYKTDALQSDKVKVIATADSKDHAPIVYPVGIIKDTDYPSEAKQFYQFIQTDKAEQIFEKYGFESMSDSK
ncbi:molybdate ABC transporter substrate-binding protein [Aquibacillus kalidii]|uniref:molybdate ABC transporter substrate-binding protein n=1 Tax=Aquibacillus kalidii TaxID=2762597 RepID=UPI00164523DB|nr:molybdate ABC transporter substrate-binding protein [Aquibacillus kalidii]